MFVKSNYAFECEEQFIEYDYREWKITLSDEIDYIGISIRHKSKPMGKDFYTTSLDEGIAKLRAEQWCDEFDGKY